MATEPVIDLSMDELEALVLLQAIERQGLDPNAPAKTNKVVLPQRFINNTKN
jgi:hypothetical protein